MKKTGDSELYERAILGALRRGTAPVPLLLLEAYPRLKLSDLEAMLLIHLLSFIEKENKEFPTIEEIQGRMSASPDLVIRALHKLMNEQWIAIDEREDPESGIRSECYNLSGMYRKLAAHLLGETKNEAANGAAAGQGSDLYSVFEKEFARLLSPMELETITNWLEKDRYSEELILAALKEAVFAGKIHFHYIDRILLEWGRNRITTASQAKDFTQKFRGTR